MKKVYVPLKRNGSESKEAWTGFLFKSPVSAEKDFKELKSKPTPRCKTQHLVVLFLDFVLEKLFEDTDSWHLKTNQGIGFERILLIS